MPYNNLVSRADVAALNTEEVSAAMQQDLVATSAALGAFRRIPVATSQTRFPVLSALPTAYLVDGDSGLKQTTEASWANKTMTVREYAAIVPIPDAVVEDAGFDVLGAVRPLVASAIARKVDAAIFFGVDAPAEWGTGIVAAATTAGHVRARGTATAAQGGIAEDINQTMNFVWSDGYGVTGAVTDLSFRARINSARATDGQRLLDVANGALDGVPLTYAMQGLWPSGAGAAELVVGDFNQGIVGVRRDFTFELSNEGVIHDNLGAVIYNAYQQDLTLLRVTFRMGFVVANPMNYANANDATRYPFAVMTAPA